MACDTNDFVYPLIADIYYPIVSQSAYGDVNKRWILGKSIACNFSAVGRKYKESVQTNVEILLDSSLIGRTRCDVRESSDGTSYAITNVIVTNIRDVLGNQIYMETSGIRNGKPTLFEIAGNEPIVGPFGSTEYWKVIIKRSDNQGVDV